MKRVRVDSIPGLPKDLGKYCSGAALYDSSCSPNARVWLSDRDGGYFIKNAPKGTLKTEADMNTFFHHLGFGPEVLSYEQLESDWMVTRRIPGEDCTHPVYLKEPERLAETAGSLLRMLHEADTGGCPIPDRNGQFVAAVLRSHAAKTVSAEYRDNKTAMDAWAVVRNNLNCLDSQVLLHGDYCLPNILLDSWRFSGFLDVGGGGIGDRHIDLYWGCWSLMYNLKEERLCTRFLDAYGRQDVQTEKLRILDAFEFFG